MLVIANQAQGPGLLPSTEGWVTLCPYHLRELAVKSVTTYWVSHSYQAQYRCFLKVHFPHRSQPVVPASTLMLLFIITLKGTSVAGPILHMRSGHRKGKELAQGHKIMRARAWIQPTSLQSVCPMAPLPQHTHTLSLMNHFDSPALTISAFICSFIPFSQYLIFAQAWSLARRLLANVR